MMPFEWDVRVSSKDHTVTAPTLTTRPATAGYTTLRGTTEYRTSPVWVGSAGDTPDTAPYVRPLPMRVPDLMTDWERFVNDDGKTVPPSCRRR